jgi:hypothetical protein
MEGCVQRRLTGRVLRTGKSSADQAVEFQVASLCCPAAAGFVEAFAAR